MRSILSQGMPLGLLDKVVAEPFCSRRKLQRQIYTLFYLVAVGHLRPTVKIVGYDAVLNIVFC